MTLGSDAREFDRGRGAMHCRRARGVARRVEGVGVLAALVMAGALALSPEVGAQAQAPRDEATRLAARQLAQEGLELLQEERYAEAQDKLQRAYEIVPAPTVALLEGRALEGMGKLIEAAERFERVRRTELEADSPEAFERASKEADADLKRIRPLIPQITLMLEGIGHQTPGFELRVDGVLVPAALLGAKRPVNPGDHEIVAILDGKVAERRTVSIEAGQHQRVLIDLSKPKEAPEKKPEPAPVETEEPTEFPYRPAAYGSFALGGAGIMTGVVSLVIMLKTQSTLDDNCTQQGSEHVCPPAYEDDLSRFRTARTLTTVGFVVGAVGLGAGVTLLHLEPDRPEQASAPAVSAWVGLGSVGVSGRF